MYDVYHLITKRNDILSAQLKIDSIHCLNFVKLFIVNDYTEYHIAHIARLPVTGNKFKKIHNIYSKIFCYLFKIYGMVPGKH